MILLPYFLALGFTFLFVSGPFFGLKTSPFRTLDFFGALLRGGWPPLGSKSKVTCVGRWNGLRRTCRESPAKTRSGSGSDCVGWLAWVGLVGFGPLGRCLVGLGGLSVSLRGSWTWVFGLKVPPFGFFEGRGAEATRNQRWLRHGYAGRELGVFRSFLPNHGSTQ